MITKEEVLAFIEKNKPVFKVHHLYLIGGLANRGWTDNDIDLTLTGPYLLQKRFLKTQDERDDCDEFEKLVDKLNKKFSGRLHGKYSARGGENVQLHRAPIPKGWFGQTNKILVV